MRLIDADVLCDNCKKAKCDYIGCKNPGNCVVADMPTVLVMPEETAVKRICPYNGFKEMDCEKCAANISSGEFADIGIYGKICALAFRGTPIATKPVIVLNDGGAAKGQLI